MIRVFACAMGVATIRLFVGLFAIVLLYGFEEVFGTAFWLGFGVNLVAAEEGINRTRAMRPSNRPLQPMGARSAILIGDARG